MIIKEQLLCAFSLAVLDTTFHRTSHDEDRRAQLA